jgi:hypothetical protein
MVNPQKNNSTTTSGPLGVIDTLSAGISLMGRNLSLLLLPILFDLFYWLMPPLRLGPELIALLVSPFDPQGANAALVTGELASDMALVYEMVELQLSQLNIWGFFVPSLLFWPSALTGQVSEVAPISLLQGEGVIWQLNSFMDVLLVLMGLMLAGLVVNVFWLHTIACSVQQRAWLGELLMLWRKTVRDSLRLLIMALVFLFIGGGALFMLSIILGIIMLLLPTVGVLLYSVVTIGLLWLIFWLLVHLYFTLAAMMLANQGLLAAPLLSMRLVRHDFRSAMTLIGLSMLLSWGFQLVWSWLAPVELGLIISIFASAALGTAITMAMMLFFTQRYELFQKHVEQGLR